MASVTKAVGTATSEAYRTDDGADWVNPTNVTADDGSMCTFTSSGVAENTKFLKCTMSGNEFAIPAGSRIDGIEVTYRAIGNTGTSYQERDAYLVVGGDATGRNRWQARNVPTTEQDRVCGSATDTWGIPLTVDAVNASNFGCALRFRRPTAAASTLQVDYISITVHYTEGAGDIAYDTDFRQAFVGFTLRPDNNTGTYKIKIPGFGTPKAVILFATVAGAEQVNASYPVAAQGVRFIWGMGVSATARSFTSNNASEVSPNDGQRGSKFDGIWNNLGSGSGIATDLNGLGTDYVELVQDSSASSSAASRREAIALVLGGADFQAHLRNQGATDGSTPIDVTDVGFEPNVILGMTGMESDGDTGHGQYLGNELILIHNPGTGNANLVKRTLHFQHRYSALDFSAISDVECDAGIFANHTYLHRNIDIAAQLEYYFDIEDFDANGYTIKPSGDSSIVGDDDGAELLAMYIPRPIAVGDFVTPTSTGSQAIGDSQCDPDIPFTPEFIFSGWSKIPASQSLNTMLQDSADASMFGLVVMSEREVVSFGLNNENNADPGDAASWLEKGGSISTYDENSGAFIQGTFTQFDDGGWTANYGTVDGTSRRGVFLAIGPAAAGGGFVPFPHPRGMHGGAHALNGGMQ